MSSSCSGLIITRVSHKGLPRVMAYHQVGKQKMRWGGGKGDGYAALAGSKVLCSDRQCWVQPGMRARPRDSGVLTLGKWHTLSDLTFLPLKSEKGGHKALAESTITEVDGIHSNRSWIPTTSWGIQQRPRQWQGFDKSRICQVCSQCSDRNF